MRFIAFIFGRRTFREDPHSANEEPSKADLEQMATGFRCPDRQFIKEYDRVPMEKQAFFDEIETELARLPSIRHPELEAILLAHRQWNMAGENLQTKLGQIRSTAHLYMLRKTGEAIFLIVRVFTWVVGKLLHYLLRRWSRGRLTERQARKTMTAVRSLNRASHRLLRWHLHRCASRQV